MAVRAKFRVQKVECTTVSQGHYEDQDGHRVWVSDPSMEMRSIYMAPVSGNGDPNHENTRFWKATPSGQLVLGTINPDAWRQFELDKSYYVDFTEAPE